MSKWRGFQNNVQEERQEVCVCACVCVCSGICGCSFELAMKGDFCLSSDSAAP